MCSSASHELGEPPARFQSPLRRLVAFMRRMNKFGKVWMTRDSLAGLRALKCNDVKGRKHFASRGRVAKVHQLRRGHQKFFRFSMTGHGQVNKNAYSAAMAASSNPPKLRSDHRSKPLYASAFPPLSIQRHGTPLGCECSIVGLAVHKTARLDLLGSGPIKVLALR